MLSIPEKQRQTWIIATILAFLTLFVFWAVTESEFLNYDDPDFVTANVHVQQGFKASEVSWAFRSLFIYWQPLTWLSYMADGVIYGPKASGFHFTNLLLHIGSTVVLFIAFLRMTARKWPSAFVAVMFAIHPLHVENVAWISERKGVLSGFFWMLAIYAYARYGERPSLRRYLPVAVCMALGLMSKSIVVTLPCVLLLLDIWPLGRWLKFSSSANGTSNPQFTLPRLVLEKVPLFALSAISSILTFAAQEQAGAVWHADRFPLLSRISHAMVSYLFYLGKTIWPTKLAVFYPHPSQWPTSQVILASSVLALLTGLAIWQFRRRPYLLVGWLIFLGVMLPVSGLFQTGEQAYADRYTYLPLIGLFVMIAWSLSDLSRNTKTRAQIFGSLAGVTVIASAAASMAQVEHWKNSQALFAHACEAVPNNYLAQTVYGTLLAEQGRATEALPYFDAALASQPRYAEAHYNLANALVQLKQYTNAVGHYRQAIAPKPDYWEAHLNLGTVLQHLGQSEDAIQAYQAGLRFHPSHFQGNFNLGTLLVLSGRSREGLECFRKAVSTRPDSSEALDRLAWLLSTSTDSALRNGLEAVSIAARANELTGNAKPQFLNTLAAAYAEAGQYQQAVMTAERALEISARAGQTNLAGVIAKLLDLYKAGQPFREQPKA